MTFQQQLPDLEAYRGEFKSKGVRLPLRTVPFAEKGLLDSLPAPASGLRGWPWDVQTAPFSADAGGWPPISVVMPSFRQGAYLEEAIRSVLLQNYPRLEFILLDGGSPDDSPAIIERYRPWLSFARVEPDRGQSHAINLGFSLAGEGGLRGWLNSDDFYLPGALRRVAMAFVRTGAGFLYGDALSVDQATGRRQHTTASLALGRYVKFPGLVPSHATFWEASGHKALWEEQQCAVDYELWIRLIPGLKRHHLPWPLGAIRIHGEAKSHDPRVRERWDEDARRNGLAHPGLYRPGIASHILAREFSMVQRLYRRWRSRGLSARLNVLRRECGWDARPLADA